MRHLSYERRLQRLGLHSLQRRRLQADLITAFRIFKGLLDIDPSLLSVPPGRRGLRGHPFKVLQGVNHPQTGGPEFSVRVVKYWNKLPGSVVTAPSVNVFKKGLAKVWTEIFPHLLHWLNTPHTALSLNPPPTSFPPSHPPWTVIISICYPTPCIIYCAFFRPVVAYVLPF